MSYKSLKNLRNEAGLTLFDLAQKSGVSSPGNLSSMENFNLSITAKTAGKLAPILGMSPDELLFQHNMAEMAEKSRRLKERIGKKRVSTKSSVTEAVIPFLKFLAAKSADDNVPLKARRILAEHGREIIR